MRQLRSATWLAYLSTTGELQVSAGFGLGCRPQLGVLARHMTVNSTETNRKCDVSFQFAGSFGMCIGA